MLLKLLIGHGMIGKIQLEQNLPKKKQSMKKSLLTHFVLFNRIFHDKENLLEIPAKHLLKIIHIKAKHSVELLPKKWQKALKNQIEQHFV